MKRNIFLIRHGKAIETVDFSGGDFDRPLTDQGIQDVKSIGEFLYKQKIFPDSIVSSPACRTRETAKYIASFSHSSVQFSDVLYTNGKFSLDPLRVFLELLRQHPKSYHTIFLIGHNTSLSEFGQRLSQDTVPSIKKSGVLMLTLKGKKDWWSCDWGDFEFSAYFTPLFLKKRMKE